MRFRDVLTGVLFLVVVAVLLWFFGSDVRQTRVYRLAPQRRVPEEQPALREADPSTPVIPVPAACCSPACKSPEKCDDKSCVCTRNAVTAKDAGAAFIQIFDPGPLSPGELPLAVEP